MITPLKELRTTLDFYPHELNSILHLFAKDAKIDWNVFLETKNCNLQRELCWTLTQKRELIWSILMRRHIPRMALIYTVDNVYKVIDGKQRLSTMLGFLYNEFSLLHDGVKYYFKDLPIEHKRHIETFAFPYMVYNETHDKMLTDDQMITWFKFINFAGTPQDLKHLEKINNGTVHNNNK